jgi:hypothetical protein
MTACILYWLHDEHCIFLQKHGYVGISSDWVHRLAAHQRNKHFPSHFEWSIIYSGTREECLALERQLRPEPGIGWNIERGGDGKGLSRSGASRAAQSAATTGVSKTEAHREAMSAAARRRYSKAGEKERTSLAVKAGLPRDHQRGERNARFGIRMSAETKLKISQAQKRRLSAITPD